MKYTAYFIGGEWDQHKVIMSSINDTWRVAKLDRNFRVSSEPDKQATYDEDNYRLQNVLPNDVLIYQLVDDLHK